MNAAAKVAGLGLTSWAAPGLAVAQTLGRAPESGVDGARAAIGLLVCLALAVGVALVLRRFVGGAAPPFRREPRRLQLLEAVRLSGRTDVCLLRCDQEEFILAVSPQTTLLVRAPKASEPPG